MTSTKVLSNHVALVPRQKLHPHVQEFQEFEELSFIDHGEVSINPGSKLQFLMIYDGATSLTTAYVVQNRTDALTIYALTITHLQEYFETYQLNPRYIVADQAFMSAE